MSVEEIVSAKIDEIAGLITEINELCNPGEVSLLTDGVIVTSRRVFPDAGEGVPFSEVRVLTLSDSQPEFITLGLLEVARSAAKNSFTHDGSDSDLD